MSLTLLEILLLEAVGRNSMFMAVGCNSGTHFDVCSVSMEHNLCFCFHACLHAFFYSLLSSGPGSSVLKNEYLVLEVLQK